MGAPPLSSEYGPPGVDLWLERSNLDGVALSCVAYGILFTLAVQTLSGLYSNIVARKRQWWIAVYVAAILAMATIGLAGNLKFNEMAYINYRNFPGGPNAFTFAFYTTPVNMMGFSTYTVMSWFTDGLVLYRFYVIYGRRLPLAVAPVFVLLSAIGCSIGLLYSSTHSDDTMWAVTAVRLGIAFWSLSVGLNIILTFFITFRLLQSRRLVKAAIGGTHGDQYVSIAAMLVESAALYSIFAVVFLITYARNSYVQNLLLPTLAQVQGIAPLLILLRVISGKAWSEKTADTLANKSRIRFGPSENGASHTEVQLSNTAYSKTDNMSGIRIDESVVTLKDQP